MFAFERVPMLPGMRSKPTQGARYCSQTWRSDARGTLMRRACVSLGIILTLLFVPNALAQGSSVKTVHFIAAYLKYFATLYTNALLAGFKEQLCYILRSSIIYMKIRQPFVQRLYN